MEIIVYSERGKRWMYSKLLTEEWTYPTSHKFVMKSFHSGVNLDLNVSIRKKCLVSSILFSRAPQALNKQLNPAKQYYLKGRPTVTRRSTLNYSLAPEVYKF